MNRQFGLGLLLRAVLVGGVWAVTYWASPSPNSGSQAIRSREGNYVVSFSVITSKTATSESWSDGDIQNVVAIDFLPANIVVQTKEGTGTVFFPERTKDLRWRQKSQGQ
jgi:hypothetical protein